MNGTLDGRISSGLQERLFPALDDLVVELRRLNQRLDLLLGAPRVPAVQPQAIPASEALPLAAGAQVARASGLVPVLQLPMSPATLVQALIAAGWGGFVTGGGIRIVKAVAPGGQALISLVPPPGNVTVAFQPARLFTNLHDPLLTITLTVDRRVLTQGLALTADVEVPFSEFLVVQHMVELLIVNGTANTATITLELILAAVKLSIYERVIKPLQELAFQEIQRYVEQAVASA